MDEKIEDVRRDIAATRARLSGTLAQLDDRVETVKHAVTHTANPFPAIRQHPWLALGFALSAGVARGMSGADRKAAGALKTGAKKAAGGAKAAAGSVKERFSGTDEEMRAREAIVGHAMAEQEHEAQQRSSTGKVLDSLRDHLEMRIGEVTDAMLDASKQLLGRRPSGI